MEFSLSDKYQQADPSGKSLKNASAKSDSFSRSVRVSRTERAAAAGEFLNTLSSISESALRKLPQHVRANEMVLSFVAAPVDKFQSAFVEVWPLFPVVVQK